MDAKGISETFLLKRRGLCPCYQIFLLAVDDQLLLLPLGNP